MKIQFLTSASNPIPGLSTAGDAVDDPVSTPGNDRTYLITGDKYTRDASNDDGVMQTYEVIKCNYATPTNYRTETVLCQDLGSDPVNVSVQQSIIRVMNHTCHTDGTVSYHV